jgi:hypothetical protein
VLGCGAFEIGKVVDHHHSRCRGAVHENGDRA